MENHSGYQRQLILARFAHLDERFEECNAAEAASDELVPAGWVPDDIRCLAVEFERLVTVALSRGFTRDDMIELYGLTDDDQDSFTRDRMSDASVDAAIKAREDCLFDALVALVPETISTGQGQ